MTQTQTAAPLPTTGVGPAALPPAPPRTSRTRRPANVEANSRPPAPPDPPAPPPVTPPVTPPVAVPARPPGGLTLIKKVLSEHRDAVARAIPAGFDITADNLIQNCLRSVMQSETLKLCDPVSVLDTVLTAANLGLDFIDQLIFIGPFERKVTDGQGHEQHAGWTAMPIVGYRGMITVAHRAGFFMDIQEVRAGDNIQVFLGTDNTINHSVGFGARGETVGAYCIIRDRDHKTLNIEVMNGQDLEACRRKTDAWVYSFGEMSRVAVTRKAFKRLPNHNRCVRLTGEVNERNFTGQSVHDLVDAAATPAPGQAA